MPIHVRRSGNWSFTDKVYIWRGGRWLRVYGAYIWSTQFNQVRWWPMFLFEQKPPPPSSVWGVAGNHNLAHFAWSATTDPTVIGHRVYMRHGNTTSGDPTEIYPPKNEPMFTPAQREMVWPGLSLDSHYTFTVKSYDEFGREGPESAPLRFWTGHPQVNYSNPSYPGYDWFHLRAQAWHNSAPLGSRTWRHGNNRWIGNYNVEQGIPKAAPAATGSIGCVSYVTAYEQICHAFGLNPPRGAIEINTAAGITKIMRVTRNVIKEKGGTKSVRVVPGWADFESRPNHARWDLESMYFESPKPGASKSVFFSDAPHRLASWIHDWVQLNAGHNAMVINDDTGPKDDDGTNYVSFAPADAWQKSDGDSWAIQCQVRFTYPNPPLSSPYFW